MLEEIEEALRGTAAATLAAYDQNTGDYLQTSNGDIWKGSYNISKSESLVDRIKGQYRHGCHIFYGDTRIMTSAVDAGGNRILNSKAGDRIVEKVLQGGESYFSHAVSIEGTLNYGYFIPVYQNGSTDEIIGMIFVGNGQAGKGCRDQQDSGNDQHGGVRRDDPMHCDRHEACNLDEPQYPQQY